MDLLAVQGTLKSLLQHHSSKASVLRRSAFFTVQLSHPYMTTGKTIALTRQTFARKVMYLLLNMLSRLVISFLPRNKRLLISWLQSSPSAVILVLSLRIRLLHIDINFYESKLTFKAEKNNDNVLYFVNLFDIWLYRRQIESHINFCIPFLIICYFGQRI